MNRFKHFALAMLVALVSNISAKAYDFEVGGIYYNVFLSNMTCEVTFGETPYSGHVTIPEHIEIGDKTFEVCRIGVRAFKDCPITSCSLPNTVWNIESGAFMNTEINELPLTDYIYEIGSYAFSDCNNLKSIFVSDRVSIIGEGAFASCI